MKTRRFFAPDMSQAMHQVRTALGDEAVILSNRQVDEGVELMVAVDYDESQIKKPKSVRKESASKAKTSATAKKSSSKAAAAKKVIAAKSKEASQSIIAPQPAIDWTQDPVLAGMRSELSALRGLLEDQLAGLAWANAERQSPAQALVFRRLTALGLETELCRAIAAEVANIDEPEKAWQIALDEIASKMQIADDDILKNGGVVALLGPPGAGKTTTIAKLAARFALHYGPEHVALLTTDTFRIAAYEQLRIYGKILGITVKSISDSKGMRSALRMMRDKRLILVDTAGMGQEEDRLKEQLAALKGRQFNLKNYLVLPAISQYLVLKESLRTFESIDIAGAIITKLDECRSLGPLLSVLIQNQIPISYVTDGQRVPEDIHLARAQTLLGNAVTLAQRNQEETSEKAFAVAYSKGTANIDT